ncbi:hypothetical protein vBBaMIFTN3_32 [Bordetella phage vB_BaM-IFTN3]|nr:hypothetical protein vBBaMIFTN1_32 [Bordetella phage vB_BaM-IFTN1]UOK17161.1 hypothetical protein vBBaMIFTN3_32 [Bordetella phage vB_BaM-IFTN3]
MFFGLKRSLFGNQVFAYGTYRRARVVHRWLAGGELGEEVIKTNVHSPF